MWKECVIDASMGWPPCFCPIEGDISGDFQIVYGMNSNTPLGKIVGVVHKDGQKAVNNFMRQHAEGLQEFKKFG